MNAGLLFAELQDGGGGPAADAEILPQAEPGAACQPLIMLAVGSRDIAWSQGPGVRSRKNLVQRFNLGYGLFGIHVLAV